MKILYSTVIAGALLLAGCGHERDPREARADAVATPIAVKTLTVAPASLASTYEAVGSVRARTAATISSKVMGYVRQVNVQAGDRVREGQLLVALDARDLDAGFNQAEAARNEARSAVPEAENAVAAAKAQLDLAQVTFKRMSDLFDKRSISNQEFDEAQAKLKVAQANYAMAQARRKQLDAKIAQAEAGHSSAEVMRSYSRITAPFSGVVTEKSVEPGNLAAPGAPLLTIEREGAYRLEVSIEESKLGAVRAGQPVTVELEAIGKTIEARVSEIAPAVDAASRAFTAKIDLPYSPQLRSGLFGRARFRMGEREAITVPAAAITDRGQISSVLVADNGTARARLVTTGERSGENVEVLSGLNPGDKVIYPAPAGLRDGAKVEVRP